MLLLRNGLAFTAMVAVLAAALALVTQALVWIEIQGINRLVLGFAADALCGVLGYFVFAGNRPVRAWLVFFSVIAFGALMVLFHDPGNAFYPLLTSLPFAAAATLAARAMGLYIEKRPDRHASTRLTMRSRVDAP